VILFPRQKLCTYILYILLLTKRVGLHFGRIFLPTHPVALLSTRASDCGPLLLLRPKLRTYPETIFNFLRHSRHLPLLLCCQMVYFQTKKSQFG
jgi:hypothetical protein